VNGAEAGMPAAGGGVDRVHDLLPERRRRHDADSNAPA
jgi:hypothetical protein